MKNKKTKSIIMLVSYFIIGLIILGVSKLSMNSDKPTNPYDMFENLNDYSYNVLYNNVTLEGTINDKIILSYENKTYDNYNIDINPIFLITNKEFSELIKESKQKEQGYDLVENMYFDTYVNNIDNKEIIIKVYNDTKKINKIIVYLNSEKVIYTYKINE